MSTVELWKLYALVGAKDNRITASEVMLGCDSPVRTRAAGTLSPERAMSDCSESEVVIIPAL